MINETTDNNIVEDLGPNERLGAIADGIDLPRIERAVREILLSIGEDPDREGLARTPARVAAAYAELFAGLREDPRRHLRVTFDEGHQ
ncbi:MAG TPA: GTP cyclohydrolase I, partial [Thermomicrobiales bacterium]|nr:GTP cyclohydrolase I [Thermomicrobiales bacterium]